MSSLNVSTLLASVAAMEKELASLKAQIAGSGAAKSAAPAAKERKPRKKSDAPPSAWLVFTARVRDLLRSVKDGGDKEVYSGKALGVECQQFCGTLKDENADLSSWSDADIVARRADWSAPAVSKQAAAGLHWKKGKKVASPTGSAAASVVSDGEAAPAVSADKPKKERKNPWAGLSPEDKAAKVAAMKAGRAAKKAAAAAESGDAASGTESVLPPLPPSPSSVASKPAAAAVSSGFRKVTLNNKAYLIDLASGHSYYRNADDSQGDWAGLFSKTPKPHIDFDAPEPSAEEDGFSLDE